MAFDKKEIKQLKEAIQPMLDNQRSETMVDTKILIQQELHPIREGIEWIKNKLKELHKMESEDIEKAYTDIEFIKKKIKELEEKIKQLELVKS